MWDAQRNAPSANKHIDTHRSPKGMRARTQLMGMCNIAYVFLVP